MAVWRYVEVLQVKVWRKLGQLPFGTRCEIDEPKILVPNLAAEKQQRMSARHKDQMSSPTSKVQGG